MIRALLTGFNSTAAITAGAGLLVAGGALAGASAALLVSSLVARRRRNASAGGSSRDDTSAAGSCAVPASRPVQSAQPDPLRESQERYQDLFDRSPLAIIEVDVTGAFAWLGQLKASGITDLRRHIELHRDELHELKRFSRFTRINQAGIQLFRARSLDEVVTRRDEMLNPDVWEMRISCLSAIWEERWEAEGKVVFKALDGTIVHAIYRWWIPSPAGRLDPAHSQMVVVDINDITRAENALSEERERREAEQQRAAKLEALSLLAGGIAHDFNNLLTVVMGNLTLAMLDTQVSPAACKWLREAEQGVIRTRDLTQQLMTFAKGGTPVRTAVALPDVVRETALFALHGSKARCTFDVPDDLWAADVDKGQITQVVQNLVINANQAMPDGGTLRIALSNVRIGQNESALLQPGSYVKLAVVDTGVGIAPENLAHIFDPYFTTKKHGFGLGLATTYSIIRKHQGHIEVDSTLGRGTRFTLWLPAANAAPAAVAPGTSTPRPRGGRVLLMDDDKSIRSLALTLFPRLGYETIAVSDGAVAVREYRQARTLGKPFDAVMLDLTVPGGMGGLQTLQQLQLIDPSVRAIVSSGYSSDPVMGNHRQYGFCGVVPKPYRMNDLTKALEEAITRPPVEAANAASTPTPGATTAPAHASEDERLDKIGAA